MTSDHFKVSGPTLFLVGVPLDESAPLGEPARALLQIANVVVGESRKITHRYLKEATPQTPPEVFLLDPPRDDEKAFLKEALQKLRKTPSIVALISDTGMPVLFDPGHEVLEFCRQLGFTVRTVPAATSWSIAMAASGFGAPFYVAGFPPREEAQRKHWWDKLKTFSTPLVILETPYRFRLLLKQAREILGAGRNAFLAWEISKPSEQLMWGPLDALERNAQRLGLDKGEFVLVIDAPVVSKKKWR